MPRLVIVISVTPRLLHHREAVKVLSRAHQYLLTHLQRPLTVLATPWPREDCSMRSVLLGICGHRAWFQWRCLRESSCCWMPSTYAFIGVCTAPIARSAVLRSRKVLMSAQRRAVHYFLFVSMRGKPRLATCIGRAHKTGGVSKHVRRWCVCHASYRVAQPGGLQLWLMTSLSVKKSRQGMGSRRGRQPRVRYIRSARPLEACKPSSITNKSVRTVRPAHVVSASPSRWVNSGALSQTKHPECILWPKLTKCEKQQQSITRNPQHSDKKEKGGCQTVGAGPCCPRCSGVHVVRAIAARRRCGGPRCTQRPSSQRRGHRRCPFRRSTDLEARKSL